jgi:YidC/Oxa1 family membrane protein insertase
MAVMLYVMPIMIAVFAIFFPAALALYWVVGNIFMVIQTIFIRKPMMKQVVGGDKK